MRSFRIFKDVIIFCVAFVLILIPAGEALAYQIDQQVESNYLFPVNIFGWNYLAQTFKPRFPILNKISLNIGSGGVDIAFIKLVRVSNGQVIFSSRPTIETWGWYSVTAPGSGIAVTPDEVLKIEVSTSSHTMAWQLAEDIYNRGEAYFGNTPQDKDFYFRVYGTPSSGATSSPGSSSSVAPLPSGDQGAAPAATTDQSMDVPKNFKAADISDVKNNEPKVKLTWDESTASDIDGYRAYSKSGSSDFALVTEVSKDTTEYEDVNVSFDTEYTYMVRAFRGDAESNSSNEATVTPNKTGKSLNPYGLVSDSTPLWKQWYFWALVVLGLALVGSVIWYIVDRKKKKKAESGIDSLKG